MDNERKAAVEPVHTVLSTRWSACRWTTFLFDPRQRVADRLRTRNSRSKRTGKRVQGKQGHCWLGSTKSDSATCDIHERHAIHEKLREGRMVEKRQGNHVPSAFSQCLRHSRTERRIPCEWSLRPCPAFPLCHGSFCTARYDIANARQRRVRGRWRRMGTKRSWRTSLGNPGDSRAAFLARMQFESAAKRALFANSATTPDFGLTVE